MKLKQLPESPLHESNLPYLKPAQILSSPISYDGFNCLKHVY